ncbi:MAG TPA: XRE family transcriptional regulator [Spirochaetia bacterium]|nr:XRE family transcriptional regulator [Spirochaetia bacterium]
MADKNTLAGKIRSTREARSMTPEQLAERADLTVELVQNIESGALIPSLTPLIRIARALGARLATFLDDHEQTGPVISRVGERDAVMRVSGREQPSRSDLEFYALSANKASRRMEPFLVDIHPLSAQAPRLSSHEGEEFVYVLTGEIEISYGRDTYRLRTGDCIYYDSIVPHHVHSVGTGDARVLAVIYAP